MMFLIKNIVNGWSRLILAPHRNLDLAVNLQKPIAILMLCPILLLSPKVAHHLEENRKKRELEKKAKKKECLEKKKQKEQDKKYI